MRFYLGTHKPGWLEHLEVPLFVSRRSLTVRVRLPRARTAWALDSGAFTELKDRGRWELPVADYVAEVERYATEIGGLEWAAPMDYMCEPEMLERTGLTVRDHQELTVANYLELRGRGPFIPVLQGWTPAEYLECLELYAAAGVDLRSEPLVGLGTVCRRQGTGEIASLVRELAGGGLRLHGFGMKMQGIAAVGSHLASADSLAWSYHARKRPPLPGCTHKACNNCPRYALRWRDRLLEPGIQLELGGPPLPPKTTGARRRGEQVTPRLEGRSVRPAGYEPGRLRISPRRIRLLPTESMQRTPPRGKRGARLEGTIGMTDLAPLCARRRKRSAAGGSTPWV